MMRWWWFGPAVTDAELDREITAMKAGGFGGFEVQPVYALTTDDPSSGIVNLPYLSEPFIAALRHANETAARLGMRMDVTIGSGWPFGGPHVPMTEAAS
ncbi:MAG: glycosyl hydrolase, partial [Povalibacter sp.]